MQKKTCTIHISPQNRILASHPGERILETLMRNSIFLRSDCGGKGKCHKCRINRLSKDGSQESLDACQQQIDSDMMITIPESSLAPAHTMEKAPLIFPKVFKEKSGTEPQEEGYGVAVDLGTTTIAIYLCDLAKREVIGSTLLKNSQAIYGDDVMSRISAISESPERLGRLHDLAVTTIEWGIKKIVTKIKSPCRTISKMVVVGNPTMIHIFLGTDPSSIGVHPFSPAFHQAGQFSSEKLGLKLNTVTVQTLPNVSGFIGGDILAGAVGAGILDLPDGTLLIDLGTNGELILKANDILLATSCATGPAFEGATLSCGMQGIPGAINSVEIGPNGSVTSLSVIGQSGPFGSRPGGICGAGIINAIVTLCQRGIVQPSGAFNNGSDKFFLLNEDSGTGLGSIFISQKDIRSVQLGKSALISGIEHLLDNAGFDRPEKIIIAGALGSHVNPRDLMGLGMIPQIDHDKIEVAGNLAGSGAVMALCDKNYMEQAIHLSQKIKTIELAASPEFQNTFIKNLNFPF